MQDSDFPLIIYNKEQFVYILFQWIWVWSKCLEEEWLFREEGEEWEDTFTRKVREIVDTVNMSSRSLDS